MRRCELLLRRGSLPSGENKLGTCLLRSTPVICFSCPGLSICSSRKSDDLEAPTEDSFEMPFRIVAVVKVTMGKPSFKIGPALSTMYYP